jgi:Domain of unknown function (DUF4118)
VLARKGVTPITGVAVLYLPTVLVVAIRGGQVPVLVTAVLSVIALNFFVIEPRYQLTGAKSDQAAGARRLPDRRRGGGPTRRHRPGARAGVGRAGRDRDAREREAILLAEAASTMLVGGTLEGQLETIGRRLPKRLAEGRGLS